MVKRDFSLQRPCFHCSRVQRQGALHHFSRRLALRMVILGLCAAARPWKPISWSSWRTVIVDEQFLCWLCSRGSLELVVSVATDVRQFVCTMRFSTQRSLSVSLCGLPRRGWAVVAPRCLHFTITAVTVYIVYLANSSNQVTSIPLILILNSLTLTQLQPF
jgi:hypothetical protein